MWRLRNSLRNQTKRCVAPVFFLLFISIFFVACQPQAERSKQATSAAYISAPPAKGAIPTPDEVRLALADATRGVGLKGEHFAFPKNSELRGELGDGDTRLSSATVLMDVMQRLGMDGDTKRAAMMGSFFMEDNHVSGLVLGKLEEYANNPAMQKYNIFMGGPTGPARYNECVAILNAKGQLCGTGVIISRKEVLTAAHIFRYSGGKLDRHRKYFITSGKKIGEERPREVGFVSKSDGAPVYDSELGINDWVVVRLVDGEFSVAPAKLASSSIIDEAYKQHVTIVGYGDTERGRHGERNEGEVFIKHTNCSQGKIPSLWYLHCDSELAATSSLGTDTCDHDSGGPLYKSDDYDNRIVLAITMRSLELGNPKCGFGGAYARVDRMRPWIDKMVTGSIRWIEK